LDLEVVAKGGLWVPYGSHLPLLSKWVERKYGAATFRQWLTRLALAQTKLFLLRRLPVPPIDVVCSNIAEGGPINRVERIRGEEGARETDGESLRGSDSLAFNILKVWGGDWLSWRDLRSPISHAPWWLVGPFVTFQPGSKAKFWLRFVRSVGVLPGPLSQCRVCMSIPYMRPFQPFSVQNLELFPGFWTRFRSRWGDFGAREQVVCTRVKVCANPGSIIPCQVVKWHLCLDEEENTRWAPLWVRLRVVLGEYEAPADRYSHGEEWLRWVSSSRLRFVRSVESKGSPFGSLL
jgi:hypothetical protein